MSTIEQTSGLDSKELLLPDDGMEKLRQQAEAKKKALEMPTKLDVSDKTWKLGNKDGKYFGSWLEGGNKNMDCPGGGKGIFKSSDDKVEARGQWNEKGTFVGADVTIDGKNFKNKKTIYNENNPSEMLELECSSTVDGKTYDCKLNKDFEISEITYAGITLKLKHESGNVYLINEGGHKLKLGNVAEDLASLRIAKCISIVKNAVENGEKDGLDYFEDANPDLDADYLGTGRDTTLLRNCSYKVGVTSSRLASWLNASRTDWGI